MRIAIVHFTAPPEIGGVESLISAQARALHRLGHEVRVVSAHGAVHDAAAVRLPLLHPNHRRVASSVRCLGGSFPTPDHPLVVELRDTLRSALVDVDQCWVHNAFTVFLHPFLTAALCALVDEFPKPHWVNWCADLSELSEFWSGPGKGAQLPAATARLNHVAISDTRRLDLSHYLGIPCADIRVVRPPLDIMQWLDLWQETRRVIALTSLFEREPVLFVPAKLLPHKNLRLAVEVAAEILAAGLHPLVLISGARSPHEPAVSRAELAELESHARSVGAGDSVQIVTSLLGRAPRRRTIRELMQLSDVVFLPSAEEGFGMPILEAAVLRAPLLCSDLPAFREAGSELCSYFGLDDGPEHIAAGAIGLARAVPNASRQAAARSWSRFEEDICRLVDESVSPRRNPIPAS